MGFLTRLVNGALQRGSAEDVAAAVLSQVDEYDHEAGVESWSKVEYASYYATSVGVYACTKLRSDAIAKPRLRIHQIDGSGDRTEVDPTHPARQFFDKVNPFWTRGRLWRATETSLSLSGQAFWGLASTSEGGAPTEAYWLHPEKMRVVPGRDQYIDGFLYEKSGARDAIALRPDEVFWLPYFNPINEFSGLSPIAAARLSIDTGIDAQRTNRALLKNQAVPRGVIIRKGTQKFTAEQAEELRLRWRKAMSGPDNAGRVAVLWGDTEYQSVALSPEEMQFIAGQRLTLQDICRILQVPPPLVADLERATYENTDQLTRLFYSGWLLDELTWITEEVNAFLMPRFGDNLVASFDVDSIEVLREDADKKAERDARMISIGRRTINEVRRDAGEEDVAWGDVWWAPFNLLPVSDDASAPIAPGGDGEAAGQIDEAMLRLSPEGRQFAGAYALLGAKLARKFGPRIDDFFTDQADRAVARFLDGADADATIPSREDADLLKVLGPAYTAAAEETLALVDSFLPAEAKAVLASPGASNGASPTALVPTQARQASAIVKAIHSLGARRVVLINDVTRAAIQQVIAEGFDKGLSRYQIAEGTDDFVGLKDVVDEFYLGRAKTIARTETAWASNTAAADRYEERGVTKIEILDGDECGWTSHDDSDRAHGSIRSPDDVRDHPVAHPNCVRVPVPTLD